MKCEDCGADLVSGPLDRSGRDYWCPTCTARVVRLPGGVRCDWGNCQAQAETILIAKFGQPRRHSCCRNHTPEWAKMHGVGCTSFHVRHLYPDAA